jgi:hypothetical protein
MREQLAPDTPVRLEVAATFAFPDGSITASGLRREAARGRLAIGLQKGSRRRGCGRSLRVERIPGPGQVS